MTYMCAAEDFLRCLVNDLPQFDPASAILAELEDENDDDDENFEEIVVS